MNVSQLFKNLESNLFQLIKRFRLAIILFWCVAGAVSSFWAASLPNYALFQFLPPEGSDSLKTYNLMSKYFSSLIYQDVELILLELKKPIPYSSTASNITNITSNALDGTYGTDASTYTSIINPVTRELCLLINETLYEKVNPSFDMIQAVTQLYEFNLSSEITKETRESDKANEFIWQSARESLVSEDESLMVVLIDANVNGIKQETLDRFIAKLESTIKRLKSEPIPSMSGKTYDDYYDLTLTGALTIFDQTLAAFIDDMGSKNIAVLPFIFLFLMYIIGSWKLIILPMLALGISIVTSFSFYVPFAKYVLNINSLAATFMMFIAMALSIDYSLFLLCRFTKERFNGHSVERSIEIMLSYSGHVVVLSGIVLIICYLGLGFFPVSGMDTAGYGAIVSISFCILVSYTLTPALVLQFPRFFGRIEIFPECIVLPILACIRRCGCKCGDSCTSRMERYFYANRTGYDSSDPRDGPRNVSNLHSESAGAMLALADESEMSAGRFVSMSSTVHGQGTFTSAPEAVQAQLLQAQDLKASSRASHAPPHALRAQQAPHVHDQVSGFYFKMSEITTKFPYNILVPLVIYGLMAPVIYQLKSYNASIDFTQNFPTNIVAAKAYSTVTDAFNPAMLNTFYILAIPGAPDNYNSQGTVWNKEFFNDTCNLARALMRQKPHGMGMKSTEFESIAFEPINTSFSIDDNSILCNDEKVNLLYNITHDYPNIPSRYNFPNTIYYSLYYQDFYEKLVNSDENAMLISASVNFNPWIGSSKEQLTKLRNIINDQAELSSNGTTFYIHSCLYWELDSLDDTYARLWWVAAGITGVVFLFIGCAFGAVILPFRLFVCVVVPICFVYGLAVGVYQKGWLNFLNVDALRATDSGMNWPLPVMTMTILIGLAMDYEIFLFSKISEYRKKQDYNDRASIIMGVAATGPIISSAGIVMALAFLGLLLQSVDTFNQMGFVMVLGVLVDTFIIRPLLVPSILSLGGWINFWPSQLKMTGLKDEFGRIEN